MSILTRMLQRRGIASQWVSTTVLASGEIGLETDTNKFKIGDGTSTWVSLNYFVPITSTLSTANTFSNTQTFTPAATTGIPLIIKGLSSQTADLQQWQDSTGTAVLAKIYANGAILTTNGITTGSSLFGGVSYNGFSNPSGITNIPTLVVKATASQTSSLQEWQNSDSTTILAKVDSTGSITANSLTLSGNLTVNGTTTTVSTSNLEVTDSLIYLASNQYTTDNLDIGFYGAYSPTGTGHVHTGLVRNATSKVWNLISGGAEPSSNIVSLTGVTYDALKVGSIQVTDGSTTRTNIGATSVGSSLFTLTNPSAITFLRINADNTVSALDATAFKTALGVGSGTGTVTGVSVVSANGFAGTVATSTSTPAITLTTSISGVLKGDGTAISAATSGTDYLAPVTGTVAFGSNTITGLGTAITGAAGNNLTISSATFGNGNLTLTSAGTGTTNLNTQALSGTSATTSIVNIKSGNSSTTTGTGTSGNIVIQSGDVAASGAGLSISGNILIDSGASTTVGGSSSFGTISIGTTSSRSITIGNTSSTTTLNGLIAATTLAAGTTTTSPLEFTTGTNLTSPLAGAVEYDGLVQYFTPSTGATTTTNGGRAIVQTSHYYVIHTSASAITNGTAAQKLLQGLATNGGISLAVGTYEVEFLFTLSNSGASTTSHTIAFNMLGTGSTATTTASHLYAQAYMFQLGNTNSSTPNMSAWTSMNTSTVLTSATTTKDQAFLIKGTMNISGAGLVVPNITFSAAPGNTTTLVIGSYFKFTPIMSNTNTTGIGAWS
jgi:hypothetical protein